MVISVAARCHTRAEGDLRPVVDDPHRRLQERGFDRRPLARPLPLQERGEHAHRRERAGRGVRDRDAQDQRATCIDKPACVAPVLALLIPR
ncbi:hypothetical protein JCM18899A_48830 [Nocardioides sp. AN3]